MLNNDPVKDYPDFITSAQMLERIAESTARIQKLNTKHLILNLCFVLINLPVFYFGTTPFVFGILLVIFFAQSYPLFQYQKELINSQNLCYSLARFVCEKGGDMHDDYNKNH